MPAPRDRPLAPAGHPPARSLLPVLVWLNRRDLAARFPAWGAVPSGLPETEAEGEAAAGEESR
jgi:hypothetical protein